MVTLKANDLRQFIASSKRPLSAILLFGPNQAKINATAKEIVIAIAGSIDDPFAIDTLEEKQLKETPGLLRDQAMSMSFTGGGKITILREPGIVTIKQIPDYLAVEQTQNLLLVQAGNLSKTSGLRKLFEKTKNAGAVAFYDDTPAELIAHIIQQFSRADKTIDHNTARVFIDSIGVHRGLIDQEIEKIISYTGRNSNITIQDIEDLSSDPLSDSIEALCDFIILGDVRLAIKHSEQLALTGVQPSQILNVISIHLFKLLSLKAEMDNGQSLDNLIRYARPPIFFKRQPTVKKQMSIWRQDKLKTALKITYDAITSTRKKPDLASTVCERTILNIGNLVHRS